MLETYRNPVYSFPFPDPFVLKFCGEYWAYGTGAWTDGRYFGILRSTDLVHWRPVGGALDPLPGGHTEYWAPEVSYWNGRFYLYYSVGNEATMQIRVAVADRPSGPFVDSGRRLTQEEFAIDAHVFEDEDGGRYLFYATDFLEHTHIGTGTVMDRLLDPFTLAGRPRPVTRARYDWQVYDPQRQAKGGVRWHTVEGPFVLKRKGLYYQMFSGGNWQNQSYGMSYAVTPDIHTPDEWEQFSDGVRVLPILRSIPNQVLGPGHNSVIRGPDNQQLFCVYHRWALDGSGRVLAIDRLDWSGERMTIQGPSNTPQPTPIQPLVTGFGPDREDGLGPDWSITYGDWSVTDGMAVQLLDFDMARAVRSVPVPAFILEVSLRSFASPGSEGGYGIDLGQEHEHLCGFRLWNELGNATLTWSLEEGSGVNEDDIDDLTIPTPADIDVAAYHLLRLEVDGVWVRAFLDGVPAPRRARLLGAPTSISLAATDTPAAFAGFALTIGWQDLFTDSVTEPEAFNWQVSAEAGHWTAGGGELHFHGPGQGTAVKGPLLDSYELVVNARVTSSSEARYGFWPALTEAGAGPLLRLDRRPDGWVLVYTDREEEHGIFPLPPSFDPVVYQQFRFRKYAGRLIIQWEGQPVGEIEAPASPTRVGLEARHDAAFDMVRVTALPTAVEG